VLRGIIEALFSSGAVQWRNIKYSELSASIWNSQRVPLQPRQIGQLVRELGFQTKISHGISVVVPAPAALLKACDDLEYTDDAIKELRQTLKKPGAT
jgi:hypothetical protein